MKAKPGITIPELADSMGIQANYLYRVMPGLQKDGKVKKRGKGWHPGLGQTEPQPLSLRPAPAPYGLALVDQLLRRRLDLLLAEARSAPGPPRSSTRRLSVVTGKLEMIPSGTS